MAEEFMDEFFEDEKIEEQETNDAERCLTFESAGLVMYMSTSYVI